MPHFSFLRDRWKDTLKLNLVIEDKNPEMYETVNGIFSDAIYQRCTVHFYRNIM